MCAPELSLASCRLDVVELAALRGRDSELAAMAAAHGQSLPALGRIEFGAAQFSLCLRPRRWLLLSAADAPGVSVARWQGACAGVAAAVDLSSALLALRVAGGAARELLLRSCRLDLALDAFPPGSAAATLMVQVSVILAALPSGMLLLTPASTGRHVRDWLQSTARSFGPMSFSETSVTELIAAQRP